jgi:hypothetical protein
MYQAIFEAVWVSQCMKLTPFVLEGEIGTKNIKIKFCSGVKVHNTKNRKLKMSKEIWNTKQ